MKFPSLSWPRLTLRKMFVLLAIVCVVLTVVAYYGRTMAIVFWLKNSEAVSFGWFASDEHGYGPKDAMFGGPQAGFEHWAELGQLRTLDWLTVGNVHVSADRLCQLPEQLKALTFFQCTFDEDALAELRRFRQLRRLDFTECELPGGDWHDVEISKTLSFLHIADSKELPSSFAWLQAHDQLEHLGLIQVEVSDTAIQTLVGCRPPESLSFSGSDITDTQLARLQPWRGDIESIHLVRSQITDVSTRILVELRPRQLNVCQTALTASALSELVSISELQELSCDGAMIDDKVVAKLHQRREKLLLRVKGNCIPLRRFTCEQEGPAPTGSVLRPLPVRIPSEVDPVPTITVEFR